MRRLLCVMGLMTVVLLPAVIGAYNYVSWQKGPWDTHDMQAGIMIYVNEESPTKVDAFRADVTINVPAEKLFPLITSHERAKRWSFMKEYKVLKKVGDRELVYQQVKNPGIEPRDFAIWTESFRPKKPNGGDYGFKWSLAKPGEGPPPKDGVVRVKNMEGVFILTPTDGGKATKASYRALFDPQAWAPVFLVNSALSDSAVEVVDRLRTDGEKLK